MCIVVSTYIYIISLSLLPSSHYQRCSGEVLFFEETATYEEPASSTVEIYQQLSNRKSREIIREYIT